MGQFVVENLQKSPNLVTLTSSPLFAGKYFLAFNQLSGFFIRLHFVALAGHVKNDQNFDGDFCINLFRGF